MPRCAFPSSGRALLLVAAGTDARCLTLRRHGQKVYKPDWFAAFREQRENEESVDEISRWVASSGLGMGAGGSSLFSVYAPPKARGDRQPLTPLLDQAKFPGRF